MVLVPNPKGGSMEVSSTADAVSKGWSPSMGTFGQSPDGGGGGGGVGGGSQGDAGMDSAAARKAAQEAAVLAGFKESSGFSREELAEKKREFDQLYAQKEAEWTRDGLPRLEIAQRLAALEDQKFQETIRQFNSSQGMDALKFASTLRGPQDYFQSLAFNRGAQQGGQMPTFLGALASNTQLPSFQGTGSVAQTPLTMGSLANGLNPGGGVVAPGQAAGGSGGAPNLDAIQAAMEAQVGKQAWQDGQFRAAVASGMPIEQALRRNVAQGYNYNLPAGVGTVAAPVAAQAGVGAGTNAAADAALNQIGSLFKAGPTQLGVGSLEKLDPNELAIMRSGADALGYDYDSWIRNYQKSGVGQTAGSVV